MRKKPDKQVRNKRGQWQKGVSGNPAGRPKSRTLSEAYREALKLPLPDDPGRTYADAVAEMLCKNAAAGDVPAARELADRTEGKPRQAVDISVEDRKRELFDNAVARLIEEAQCTREEAVQSLLAVMPEASQWVN